MDLPQVLSDAELLKELTEKLPELVAVANSGDRGLQGLDVVSPAHLEQQVNEMAGGIWGGDDPALEAIVERFTRPVLLVQDQTYGSVPDDFENSTVIAARLDPARARLEACIPSIGRINVENHRKSWIGTGWLIAPQVLATNQHVAQEIATHDNAGFRFRKARSGKRVRASIDWCQEYNRGAESVVEIDDITWLEDEESGFDAAFLHLAHSDREGSEPPPPLELMALDEIIDDMTAWIAVVGYPAQSIWNNPDDQQRIFDGLYGFKRLAPGRLTAVRKDDRLLDHDATTLGGNSGSAVISMASGKVAGLHFGGIEKQRNMAVQAPVLAELLKAHG